MTDDFWERAARIDPLWAVLSDPQKTNRRWDPASFFETGQREISILLYQLRSLGYPPGTGRALDFGCGVGRLAQAIASVFDTVVAVDVSPTMIRLANLLDRHPGKVHYVVHDSESLEVFGRGTFDFVYSNIVLQHLQPRVARRYVQELLRLLTPGGIAVFQLASRQRAPQDRSVRPVPLPEAGYRARIRLLDPPPTSMRAGDASRVEAEITNVSPEPWNQQLTGVMRAGNHWRGPDGAMIVQDDGRTLLPSVVESGESARVSLTVQAPEISGRCTCEFDVVHEAVSWFADRGSETTHASVTVRSTVDGAMETAMSDTGRSAELPDIYQALPPSTGLEIGSFPMYGVPKEEVLALIEAHGGRAFHIEVDERAGPEWEGFRYFVAKD